MAQSKALTGPELETLGLMKFTCDTCRDIFPVRCDDHRQLVMFEGNHRPKEQEPDDRKLELLLRQERNVRTPKALAFGKPLLEYSAPYEVLEVSIAEALRESHE